MKYIILMLLIITSNSALACSLQSWDVVENHLKTLSTIEDNDHFIDQCGLRLSLDGLNFGYVEDQTPGKVFPNVDEYFAQFRIFLDAVNFENEDTLEVFSALDSSGATIASLEIKNLNSALTTQLTIKDDGGYTRKTGAQESVLSSGWHDIKLTWRAAELTTYKTGEFILSIDDAEIDCASVITNINNPNQRIASIRLGAISTNNSSIAGSIDFDAFQSTRIGETLSGSCDSLPFNLPHNQWRQIALPGNPGELKKVRDIFGDELPIQQYGSDWIIFSYDAQNNRYLNPGINGSLEQGIGYWIIQATNTDVILDIDVYDSEQSSGFVTNLFENGTVGWNLTGFTDISETNWSQYKLKSSSGICSQQNGCTVAEAYSADIFHNQAWTYDGSAYAIIEDSTAIPAWTGFWCATLSGAKNLTPQLIHP